MANYRLKAALLFLFCSFPVSSFIPSSIPESRKLSENIKDDNKIEFVKNEEIDLLASLRMDETMVLQAYDKLISRIGSDNESTNTSSYPLFKKKFLADLETTMSPKEAKANSLATSLGIDEVIIRQEYIKWLARYEKTADSSRYPQFKINFLLQFQHDMNDGTFYMLNEFADCTEAEAKTQSLHLKKWEESDSVVINEENPADNISNKPEGVGGSSENTEKIHPLSTSVQEKEKRKYTPPIRRDIYRIMHTPAIRRDIYRIMRNSDDLNVGLVANDNDSSNTSHQFSVALLAEEMSGTASDNFIFVDRKYLEKRKSKNDSTVFDDNQMLGAIESIGANTCRGLAITNAFEAFLSQKAINWSDNEVSSLSVDFLVAFGNELAERLDIHHRIRSSRLTKGEARTLQAHPFASCINNEALELFQGEVRKTTSLIWPTSHAERRKRPPPPQHMVEVKVRTKYCADEMMAREQDAFMFTSSVRRDIYTILRNPNNLQFGASIPVGEGSSVFGSVLLAKKSSEVGWDTYLFANRRAFERLDPDEHDYVALSDEKMIEAVGKIGIVTPLSLALTEAFEAYLSQLAKNWGDRDVSCLSVETLLAFGRELTPRLDINNRIRSRKLSDEELLILSSESFAGCVDMRAMQQYQSCSDEI